MELKTLTLPDSKQTVEMKAALGWYDLESVEGAMITRAKVDGAKFIGWEADATMVGKIALMGRAIVSIKNEDGTVVPFSQAWVEGLTFADGSLLDEHCESLKKK